MGGDTMKYLIVVDMQVDFITGSLGSEAAQAIVANVLEKVKSFEGEVIFTRDTHEENYLQTQEGRKLPVRHCIRDTEGWQICPELRDYAKVVVDKPTFGSMELVRLLEKAQPEEVHLCGLCTDICVISNAMLVKAAFPEVPIYVDAACCAGVTAQSHKNALDAMRAVQIEVVE